MSISVNVFYAYLAQQLDAGGSETIVYLDRITTRTGEAISTSDFATVGRGILTVNPDGDGNTSFPEFVSFTGVSGLTLTGATRGLSAKDNTPVAANKRFHPVGTPVVISFGTHNLQDVFDYIDNEIGALTVGSNMVMSGLAGQTVSAGQIVYLNTDGRWWLADADVLATLNDVMLGIAQGSGTAGNSITNGILRKGTDSNQSGLVAGTNYFVSNTAGGISTSAGTHTRKIGVGRASTQLYFDPEYAQLPTSNEKAAMSGGAEFGTPSSTNKFVTNDKLEDRINDILTPQVIVFSTASPSLGGASTTRFDITNPSGNTFRYTWDGTGTNPNITSSNPSVGSLLFIQSPNFNANNNGVFVVTNSGTNFFEVTNASGVAQNDVTLDFDGYIIVSNTNWTKDPGLKYIVVEGVGGGGGCDSDDNGAGSGGGYFRKLIPASSLAATEAVIIGEAGISATASISQTPGRGTAFGLHCRATGGNKQGGRGGIGVGGDINIQGQEGEGGGSGTGANYPIGGASVLGLPNTNAVTTTPSGYGVGAIPTSPASAGVIIVTEYYT